jgi:hypothetical protein
MGLNHRALDNFARIMRIHHQPDSGPDPVANAEDDRIRYRPRKQPQRAVLPTEQVVSKVEAAEHIETASTDTDDRTECGDRVVGAARRYCARVVAYAEAH